MSLKIEAQDPEGKPIEELQRLLDKMLHSLHVRLPMEKELLTVSGKLYIVRHVGYGFTEKIDLLSIIVSVDRYIPK